MVKPWHLPLVIEEAEAFFDNADINNTAGGMEERESAETFGRLRKYSYLCSLKLRIRTNDGTIGL